MTDGFDVRPEELHAHAKKLEAMGDRLKTAQDAANEVTMNTDAYGQICSFFVPTVQDASQPGIDALARASTAIRESARKVVDTAETYETTDASNAESLSGWDIA